MKAFLILLIFSFSAFADQYIHNKNCFGDQILDACQFLGVYGVKYIPPYQTGKEKYESEACFRGNADSCIYLALEHKNKGDKIYQKFYFQKACDLESKKGCDYLIEFRLRTPLQIGDYIAACNNGHKHACYEIAIIEYNSGKKEQAKNFFRKSCLLKEYNSCFYYGLLDLRINKGRYAERIWKHGCDNNNPLSCSGLGDLALKNGNKDEAINFFEGACKAKHGASCYKLGQLSRDFNDPEKARQYFLRGCKLKNEKSCFSLPQQRGFKSSRPKSRLEQLDDLSG